MLLGFFFYLLFVIYEDDGVGLIISMICVVDYFFSSGVYCIYRFLRFFSIVLYFFFSGIFFIYV